MQDEREYFLSLARDHYRYFMEGFNPRKNLNEMFISLRAARASLSELDPAGTSTDFDIQTACISQLKDHGQNPMIFYEIYLAGSPYIDLVKRSGRGQDR